MSGDGGASNWGKDDECHFDTTFDGSFTGQSRSGELFVDNTSMSFQMETGKGDGGGSDYKTKWDGSPCTDSFIYKLNAMLTK